MKNSILIILLFSAYISFSQSYIGYNTDNCNGLHGVLYNPGALADSRTKVDINLFSASGLLATDYTYLTLDNISNILGDGGFDELDKNPSNSNEILANLDILGPSFMFSLNERSSFALITRVRLASNFNNINGELFQSIYDGFPVDDFNFEQENLDFTTHAWAEIGLSYGRVLFEDSKNLFKGGVILKYLIGGGALQGSSNSLSGNYTNNNDQVSLNGDFSYAISYDDEDSDSYFNELSPGFGTDIGFVYEYRTNETLASSNANNPRAFNQYKLKIGLSILDIGSINYKNSAITDYTINANLDARDLEDDFIEELDNNSTETTTTADIKISLPTSMRLNIDYNIHNKFYINLDLNQGLVSKDNFFNNNRLNLITLTPRFETRVFGAYLPISHSSLSKTNLGLGLRIGPLFLGSGTLFSNLSKKANAANFYVGVKILVYHKRALKGE
ncbi:hypothetical protein CLV90_0553 [Maribacter spongiicola]|uniref:DUF5723 domain-containing protein n=1 Tax=Maribacter spongiicola TaxID=1206753 RepID=A0A4R7K656_9FLAO|nr:DUF5723 family protein [Maribacter spongiicola]TDT46500.1 hypothetical protein CLV90_0553 [Maribacter spongiicola]